MKYQLTTEDRQKGFRATVLKYQVEFGLEFNEAVQAVKRKICPGGNWQLWREKEEQKKRIQENLRS